MNLAVAYAITASVAHAQDTAAEDQERAKVLFAQGQAFYESGRFEEAVQALSLAYDLSGKPLLLFNLTAPLERLGRWPEALEALEGYRPYAKPDEIEEIERRLTTIRERVEEQEAKDAALAEAGARSGPPASAIVLFGVGAVGLGTGTVFTARALSARSEWKGLCAGDPGLCPAEADPTVKRDRTSSVIADISMVAGVAAVGGGFAILLGSKKKKSANPEVSLWMAPTPAGASAGLGGSF